ncbi:hypothetical protein [Alkalibacterium kapii]|uniref:Uncharacterized protein n=1 Tax=Alkalibacterium kapii TaxID=426704 RepID=A0A511AZP0_9LACT|nr:hypothetical protein [Alkalibacterium kapii]GEK91057.1 hypothetical protein AKA01nite_06790 [Alkalibacterium kapii]
MTLYAFMSEVWKMVKDYLWLILGTIILVVVAGLGLQYALTFFGSSTESDEEIIDDDTINQVGVISLHADSDFKNIRLNPELHPDLIEEIKGMKGFSTDFAVNTNPAEEDEGETGNEPVIDLDSFETANILELLLGIDPTQHARLYEDPDTGNLLMSLEINADSGDVRLVEATSTTDVIEVQLDVSEAAETENFSLPSTDADLMNIGWNFTPDGDSLMSINTVYDFISGMNYPIQLNDNRRNIRVANPTEFNPIIDSEQGGFNVRALITRLVLLVFGGTLLGLGIAFVLSILSKTIKYSFTYGWNADELFLKFDESDSAKLVAHDMLVSENNHVAIVAENQLDGSLVSELSNTSKDVGIFNSIEHLDVSDKIDEIVLVVQRNFTSKDWYRRQRKHVKAYRNIDIKIAEV